MNEKEILEYIDGKFIRNGVVVAPVFGNLEQLALLNLMNSIKERVKNGEYDLVCYETECGYEIRFRCLCGRLSYIHPNMIEDEFETSVEMKVGYSCKCGKNWVGKSEEGFSYNFKLKTK